MPFNGNTTYENLPIYNIWESLNTFITFIKFILMFHDCHKQLPVDSSYQGTLNLVRVFSIVFCFVYFSLIHIQAELKIILKRQYFY